MKTITEFSGSVLRDAARLRGEATEGTEQPYAALGLADDRLARLLEALEVAKDRVADVRRVRVMQLVEGEAVPQGAVKHGDHVFFIEFPLVASRSDERDRRQQRRGRPEDGMRRGLEREPPRNEVPLVGAGWMLSRAPDDGGGGDRGRGRGRGRPPGDRRGPPGGGGDRRPPDRRGPPGDGPRGAAGDRRGPPGPPGERRGPPPGERRGSPPPGGGERQGPPPVGAAGPGGPPGGDRREPRPRPDDRPRQEPRLPRPSPGLGQAGVPGQDRPPRVEQGGPGGPPREPRPPRPPRPVQEPRQPAAEPGAEPNGNVAPTKPDQDDDIGNR